MFTGCGYAFSGDGKMFSSDGEEENNYLDKQMDDIDLDEGDYVEMCFHTIDMILTFTINQDKAHEYQFENVKSTEHGIYRMAVYIYDLGALELIEFVSL